MLKVQNLKKYFGGIKAVDDCSFEVETQTITALVGPNGSGKTTIFNIISGILKADKGQIFFEGKEITNRTPEEISNLGISRMFQQSRLFKNLTVKENLLLALDNEDTKFWKNLFGLNKITQEKERRIKEMLALIEIQALEDKFTKNISFGQKRLVELVRTILNNSKLLMLDEPVAGVNPKIKAMIAKILLEFKKKGKTILLIEHDMNFTLALADEVIVLDEGKLVAKGRPEEIKNNPKILEIYLGK